MKTLATISMALIFGTLTISTAPALAGGKGQHSSGNSHHNSSSSSSYCKKPCDPCKDKCPSGGTTAPVQPPVNTIHPIINPIVRDHRGDNTITPIQSGGVTVVGGTVVRDHRGDSTITGTAAGGGVNTGSPIARDHRGTGATSISFNGSPVPITPVSTGNPFKGKGQGNQTVANPTTPLGEALQGLDDALGDAFGSILPEGFSGPPIKKS
jgi:hypothetical protein